MDQNDFDPVLAALAGAIEFHRGNHERAIPYLECANRVRPQDAVVRGNLVESLLRCGRADEALALCDNASIADDRSMRLARLAAHLSQEAGDYERAVTLYRSLVTNDSADWALWNNLGNALSAMGDHVNAAQALESAVRLAPDSPPIRLNLGNELIEAGRYEEAEKTLQSLAQDFLDDPRPMLSLFSFYRRAGLEERAYRAIAEAARRAPDDSRIQCDFGQEASRRNEYDLAEPAFEAALALEPDLAPALVGLAMLYERVNREAELDPLRERALNHRASDEAIALIDALRHRRAGRIEDALAALDRSGNVVTATRRMHLRGTLLDRLGRHDEAFEAFVAMNQASLEEPGDPLERAREYRLKIMRSLELLSPQWFAGWSAGPAPDPRRRTPVFLGGFPRSGTTLLDTMLMADPKVVVLEEKPFVAELERDIGGIDALANLDAETIQRGREQYWNRVSELAEVGPDTLVVDKQPLHTNNVSTILRYFPDARFILALRHPCDVLLSCFLTNFRTNHGMSNFLDLGDAATLYDLTFSHWERSRQIFGLPVRTVVYERLVEDKARELRPLFEWLDLDWPGDEHDHREAARARGLVTTASYAQVIEPLYKRAAGRWHNYAKHLEPVLDRMRPWVERYGYSLEDGRFAPWPDEAIDAA